MQPTPKIALVVYDLLILKRGAEMAFSRRRDMLLLALVVTVGILCVWNAAGALADKTAQVSLGLEAVLVGLVGGIVAQAVAARLGHLREHTVMARYALKRRAAGIHAGFWGLPPLLAALAVFVAGPAPALEAGILLVSYAAGAAVMLALRALPRRLRRSADRRRGNAAGAVVRDLQEGSRRRRMIRLMIARAGLRQVPAAANIMFFAGAGVILGLLVPLRRSGPLAFALLFAAFASALLVGRAMRQHPPLLRYLLFLGIMPTGAALVPLLPVTVLVVGFVTAAALLHALPVASLVGGAAAFLAFLACLALLRAYHGAAKSPQAAEFALQIDLAMIAATALVATPLAPVLLAARLWTLHRAAAALRHSLR